MVYKVGNQKFGVATIVPPSFGAFTLMKYVSHEDKSLQLPFSLQLTTTPKSNGNLDFFAQFKLTKQQDFQTDESYFPTISDVSIQFLFPPEVSEVPAVSSFPNYQEASSKLEGAWYFSQGKGKWTFDPSLLMENDQDSVSEKC